MKRTVATMIIFSLIIVAMLPEISVSDDIKASDAVILEYIAINDGNYLVIGSKSKSTLIGTKFKNPINNKSTTYEKGDLVPITRYRDYQLEEKTGQWGVLGATHLQYIVKEDATFYDLYIKFDNFFFFKGIAILTVERCELYEWLSLPEKKMVGIEYSRDCTRKDREILMRARGAL